MKRIDEIQVGDEVKTGITTVDLTTVRYILKTTFTNGVQLYSPDNQEDIVAVRRQPVMRYYRWEKPIDKWDLLEPMNAADVVSETYSLVLNNSHTIRITDD
jgi:phosphoribosylanthranilate isomerase